MSNYADDANALNRADAASVSIGPSAGTATRNITTSTNTQVKTGAGIFNGLNVNTGQSGASIKVYDGTDNTGPYWHVLRCCCRWRCCAGWWFAFHHWAFCRYGGWQSR
jgi:hypothetical protein